ncbi:hypothetical protein FOL47_011346, partial [Perkinsus chesapeaki]
MAARPLKKESKLSRKHARSTEDEDRSETVRKKLEEKASLYEKMMQSAARTMGGGEDTGNRLVNFGDKVKMMDAWQSETERFSSPPSSSSNLPPEEVQGNDGGIRQVFE